MKNSVTCPNCNSENPFYNSVCSGCKFYLRDRIYNIDLWTVISSLIESPSKAFRTIIFSEHKNFIVFIFVFLCIKYLINARFLSMITVGFFESTVELYWSYLIVSGSVFLFFLLFCLVHLQTGKALKFNLRFKDSLAIIIFAQIPFLFGLVILFPLEQVIFGDYLFSLNPNPIIIKGTIAYVFLAVEIALVIWSMFFIFKAFKAQSQHLIFSLLSSFIFVVLFWTLLYFCSVTVFTV
jgi:hypothetical protein